MPRGRAPKTQRATIINGKQNVVVNASEGGFSAKYVEIAYRLTVKLVN